MSGVHNHYSENTTAAAAVDALRLGFHAIPVRSRSKQPHIPAWPHKRWSGEEEAATAFQAWADEGVGNIGLILGEASGGLVDVDLDHPKALRLRDHLLPPTPMRTGTASRPGSHHWYLALGDVPGTRQYRMPDHSISVELRSTNSQTLIPPSVHPTDGAYLWSGEPWGGESGPAPIDARVLSVQVALLGLGVVLLDQWPAAGGRHDAYLALAGGLLRHGEGVHPYWERNCSVLIRALARASHDSDGPEVREREVVGSTLARLRAGGSAVGFPRLGELIGSDHAELVRRMVREVESLAGFSPVHQVTAAPTTAGAGEPSVNDSLPPEERDPLAERIGSWQPVDLGPYLTGEVMPPDPTVLRRSDGCGLLYEGRVNSLYGQSEAAKSWIAMIACQQEMALGERVVYIDLEDEPTFTLHRMRLLGIGDDDIRHQFTYIRPEDPHQDMQRNRWGQDAASDLGRLNSELFAAALDTADPSLIIVDGMTVLYGLHGLDSNDAASTDVITTWLKRLCRNGRSTVVVIDHTGKSPQRGSAPIGAHHKIAMVQGTALQVVPISQPMPGRVGTVELIVFKDRPGGVRAVSSDATPAVAALVTLDSTDPTMTLTKVEPPDPTVIVLGDSDAQMSGAVDGAALLEERNAARREHESLRQAIVAILSGDGGTFSRRELAGELAARNAGTVPAEAQVRLALRELVGEGAVTKTGTNRWARYSAH